MLTSSWMLPPFHRTYIFVHHFPYTTQVTSTERPAIPTFMPLLDTLKAEESVQRGQETIQGSRPQYKDAARESQDESKEKSRHLQCYFRNEESWRVDRTAGKTSREESSSSHSEGAAQVGPTT